MFCLVYLTIINKKKKKAKKQTVQKKTPVVEPQFCSLLTNSTGCSPRLATKGVPLGACSLFLRDSAKQGEKLERWKEMVTSEFWLFSQLLIFLDNSNQLSIS